MDERIIERCLSGEPEAYEEIVQKYQSSLLALAVQVLRDREEARDTVQDTLVQAYLNLKRYTPGRGFRTWIHSIAYKRCLDRLRKRKTQRTYMHSSHIRKEDLCYGPSEQGGLRAELWSALLNTLNDKERLSLYLFVQEGYSAREISEIFSCAESTVRVLVHRAKVKLRASLKGKRHQCVNSLSF
jgi:RNA polymerase sigma factor (sigma-70 family)